MTHSTPDLDGMASAIALSQIIGDLGKECYIVAPKNLINKTLNKALKCMSDEGIILPFKYEKSINTDSLLILLDVREGRLTECEKLVSLIKDKCIIDHHSTGLTSIDDVICEYLDDSISSTVQIICEYMKYLDIKVDAIFNTALLAGLYQDTNYFNYKTSSKTFLIASYLIDNGADTNLSHYFLKESMKSAISKYEYIKKVRNIGNNAYLCVIDDRKCSNITTAKVCDELIKFDDVKLAFAVGEKDNGDVVISARSCDDVDVCQMMKELGGGGHFGAAAACVRDDDLDDVILKLENIVRGI
jgi:c-di-AMP phosphodiesterase-like protein